MVQAKILVALLRSVWSVWRVFTDNYSLLAAFEEGAEPTDEDIVHVLPDYNCMLYMMESLGVDQVLYFCSMF